MLFHRRWQHCSSIICIHASGSDEISDDFTKKRLTLRQNCLHIKSFDFGGLSAQHTTGLGFGSLMGLHIKRGWFEGWGTYNSFGLRTWAHETRRILTQPSNFYAKNKHPSKMLLKRIRFAEVIYKC